MTLPVIIQAAKIQLFILSFILGTLFATTANAERRALLMGNKDYQVSPLNNPINDVNALKIKLKKLGFTVTLKKNLNRKQMRTAIRSFKNTLSKGDLAVVYYSGHGAQVNGDNYLIPINNDIRDEFEISDGGVSLNFLIKNLVNAGSTNIIILDACRDNPFKRRFKSSSRGLARIKQKVGGTLVAFAASAGGVSQDGNQSNGTYTKYLLRHIGTSGITLNQMFTRVRKDVVTATGNDQFPIEENGLLETIYLAGNQSRQANSSNNQQQAISDTTIPPQRKPYEPEMALIRGGTFMMGSPSSEKDRYTNEKQHQVRVKDFWIGKTEVTFAQWDACAAGGGCKSNKRPSDEGWGRGNRPVINVSWHDANEYTRWLSQKTGKKYRLPTEAEWEYAARGKSTSTFSFGSSYKQLCQYGNHADQSVDFEWKNKQCNDGVGNKTAQVGQYKANRYGLKDMHGNVYEWVCSGYDENYNGSESKCAKRNDSRSRVLRGGSWYNEPRSLRSANRFWLPAPDRHLNVGFRISRTF